MYMDTLVKLAALSFFGTVKSGEVMFGLFENQKKQQIATLEDLEMRIASDIITILINGTIHEFADCSDETDASRTTYWFVNPDEELELFDTYDKIVKTEKVVYILHGWGGSKDVNYTNVIWEAYYSYTMNNIIVVDYGAYAKSSYQNAVCNIPYVAQNLAIHICRLSYILGIRPEMIHIVSHSLGSHVAGLAGQYTKRWQCGTIGRITALDPAGPLFQLTNEAFRLDKTDALFVDAIHTNQGQYGYIGSIGHIDFYPNCGFLQPGCDQYNEYTMRNKNLLKRTLDSVTCNHQRSCYLFAESIKHDVFRAMACPRCGGLFCRPPENYIDTVYMGENCTREERFQSYYVDVTGKPPYGKGPDRKYLYSIPTFFNWWNN